MSVRHQAARIFIAASKEWGKVGPLNLWAMAGFRDQDAIRYLSEHFSTKELHAFDLAEIMSKAVNRLAGDEISDAVGSKLRVVNDRVHDLMSIFSVDSDSADAARLRKTIMQAAVEVIAENHGGPGEAPEEAPRTPGEPEAPTEPTEPAEPPEAPGSSGPIVVDRDPELWASHLGEDVDESVAAAFIRSGRVLVIDSAGRARLFVSEAAAEEEFGSLAELPQAGSRPPSPPVRQRDTGQRDTGQRDTPREPSQSVVPPDLLPKMRDARELALELMSIRGSIERQTGFDIDPWKAQAAYAKMTEALGGRPSARLTKREYHPASDNRMLDRLQGLLHDMLERRDEMDAAGMNTYPLQYLNEELYEFLERHGHLESARSVEAASCDVLRRWPNRGMPKDGKKPSGPKGIALNVLKKEAIQLSKGNIRATKDGTITIDPGLMNCPVVREVMRQLETKASDMRSVRERLDELGMLVTQGEHGQVQVYCLVRSESEGGARTKICQWFIDAHGNDGKFKIECAKD